MNDAATKLSNQNMQLFTQSGVLNIITTLRNMAALNPTMPVETFDMYRTKFTPRWTCTSWETQGLLQTSQGSRLRPVWEREEKLNIRSGSVVVQHGN